MQHYMSRDDDSCCLCRNASWEIFKRRFFPSVKKTPRYRKFPQLKAAGKDSYSRETEATGAESLTGEEHRVSVPASLVWGAKVSVANLVVSAIPAVQENCSGTLTVSSAYRNKTGLCTRGLWRYIMERKSTLKDLKINVQRCFRMSLAF